MPDNREVAGKISRIGKLMELMGDNPFKIRAYLNGADAIDALHEDLDVLIREDRLRDIPGIGEALREKITSIHSTGSHPLLDKLESEIPSGVAEMMRIKGLGAKKIISIWKEMNITSPGDLLQACNENRLVQWKGFGEKIQETIGKAVEYYLQNQGKFHYARIFPLAMNIAGFLEKEIGKENVSLTGEIRRKLPVVERIEILVADEFKKPCLKILLKEDGSKVVSESDSSADMEYGSNSIPLRIYFSNGNFPLALFKTTGSEKHLESAGNLKVKSPASEEDIYRSLGLSFVEPELREGTGEVKWAKDGKQRALVTIQDLKGCLHNHSTWSDGLHSIEDMAKVCIASGLVYFGISDHSRSAVYANGLSPERVIQQQLEIDKLNVKLSPFKIFKGIESDILADGSLDFPDEILKTFDFIVASIHSQTNMDEEKATARLIRAIENPYTSILGHPTGRLLLMRRGYPINHRKVIDACAANGVAIEMNSNPYRLDIDWSWIPYCLEKDVMISINPDAHKVSGIQDMEWGIAAARKGGLVAAMTLNAKSEAEIAAYFENRKS